MTNIRDILGEIFTERQKQDAKWGVQNHPDWSFDYYNESLFVIVGDANDAKELCDEAFAAKRGSYTHILLEEMQEAFAEARDGEKEKLREELIQIAAVAVAWIEKLDRERLVTSS
jgi:hypothetical protein